MLIIRCMGGLGNQMFQFALYYTLKRRNPGKTVKFDISHFNSGAKGAVDVIHNGYELRNIFGIEVDFATKEDIENVIQNSFIEKSSISYNPKVFRLRDGLIIGYWQTSRYFERYSLEIRNCFTFRKSLDERNNNLKKEIANTDSVSVHVRRTDFLASPPHNNLSSEYYDKALLLFQRRLSFPWLRERSFFVFSDDIKWVQSHLHFPEKTRFIDWNVEQDSWKDMVLMSLCKHNIIANSTFSWWAAWLNSNSHKKVICPDKWFVNPALDKVRDHFPRKWKVITTAFDEKKRQYFIRNMPVAAGKEREESHFQITIAAMKSFSKKGAAKLKLIFRQIIKKRSHAL